MSRLALVQRIRCSAPPRITISVHSRALPFMTTTTTIVTYVIAAASSQPLPRSIPTASLGIPTSESTLGMRQSDWHKGRYACALDAKLSTIPPKANLAYLRREHQSLTKRYSKLRAGGRQRVGFDESIPAVEHIILWRQEVVMGKIFEMEAYENGLQELVQTKVGLFRGIWDRARLAMKGKSIWKFLS